MMNNKNFSFLISILKKHMLKEILGLVFTLLLLFLFYRHRLFIYLDNVLISKDFDKLPQWLSLFFISCIFQPVTNFIKIYIFFNVSETINLALKKGILKNVISALFFFSRKST